MVKCLICQKKAGIPEVVPPEDEESEDPPGEWTEPDVMVGDVPEMWVSAKRTVYVWLRRGKSWARLYLDARNMGLISVNDPAECPVLEVRDKYVLMESSSLLPKSSGSPYITARWGGASQTKY